MAKVYMLVGKIASGKTTWAMERKAIVPLVLLSCDDLMLDVFAGCLGDKHGETERRCLNFLFGQAVQLVEMGLDVVLDSGFWTKKSRAMARVYFSEKQIEIKTYYFKTPEDVRIERLQERNARLAHSPKREFIVDAALLAKLDKKFEEPLSNEVDFIVGMEK
ncbi:MAG: ATP-binding protein [Clostridiales bacterium]|nr:ATP-binding protein [Clostridiales bacterium]